MNNNYYIKQAVKCWLLCERSPFIHIQIQAYKMCINYLIKYLNAKAK